RSPGAALPGTGVGAPRRPALAPFAGGRGRARARAVAGERAPADQRDAAGGRAAAGAGSAAAGPVPRPLTEARREPRRVPARRGGAPVRWTAAAPATRTNRLLPGTRPGTGGTRGLDPARPVQSRPRSLPARTRRVQSGLRLRARHLLPRTSSLVLPSDRSSSGAC